MRLKLLGVPGYEINPWRSATDIERLLIEGPHVPKVVTELRELDASRYDASAKCWTVALNSRNIFTLDILSQGEFYHASSQYGQQSLSETELFITKTVIGKVLCSGLWSHQRRSLIFKIARRRFIDAGEMGIGKTLSTIRALQFWQNELQWSNGWWVAPNSGLMALRTQMVKFGALDTFRSVKLLNYHGLERALEEAKEPPQTLVFDECHALKNANTRRTQLAMSLTEEMEKKYGKDCAVIGLTGTPSPENYFDWWSLCEVIRPGWLKENSSNKYKYRIANFGRGERIDGGSYPKFEGWKQDQIELLPRRLDGLVHVTWKRDCLDLPEKVYEVVELPFLPVHSRVAKVIAKTASRAVEAQIRLRQLSDGFRVSVSEDGRDDVTVIETPKDAALRDILSEYRDAAPHRIVIYAAFHASIDKLFKLLVEEKWNVWQGDGRGQKFYFQEGWKNDTNQGISESIFQDANTHPQPIAFLGNPESFGQSITLTPSPAIIYYSNTFKSQYRVQSEDRIHRFGADKERGCKIIDFVWLPTDRLVLDKLKSKRDAEVTTLEEIDALFEEGAAKKN